MSHNNSEKTYTGPDVPLCGQDNYHRPRLLGPHLVDLPHPIVAFAGKKRAGKDFLADRVAAHYKRRKVHIAEWWLREWCSSHGLDPEGWETHKFAHRAAIQKDAAAARAADPLVLINALKAGWSGEPIILTGVRFHNEVAFLKNTNSVVLRVSVDDDTRRERMTAAGDDLSLFDDPFESEIDELDATQEVPGDMLPADVDLFVAYLGSSLLRRFR